MSIATGQLVATSKGNVPVDSLLDGEFTGFTYRDRSALPEQMTVVELAEPTNVLWRVETWFEGGCRDCTHYKAKGLLFIVGPDTEFLLSGGQWFNVSSLQNGHQLRVLGRNCGYEVVKSTEKMELEWTVPVYTVEGADLFALGDDHLPNKVLIKT